jgi:hypothetical protein
MSLHASFAFYALVTIKEGGVERRARSALLWVDATKMRRSA